MSTSLQKKLRLKPGMRVLTINAPSDFKSVSGTSESDITTGSSVKNFNQIHWFVKTPEDLQLAFKKDKKAAAFYETLAFSHRKEYVEWIVTAKREETRIKRVEGTIERLNKSWKNPANN